MRSIALADQLARLRADAAACRAAVIAFDRKLAMLEDMRPELGGLRRRLARQVARIDAAVCEVLAALARSRRGQAVDLLPDARSDKKLDLR